MKAGQGLVSVAAALALCACASTPAPPPFVAAADLSEPAASAAPAKTVLYTDCITQAISNDKVAHVADADTKLIRFTCSGAPAQRFYEALAVLGDQAVSVWQANGRTYRATAKVKQSLFGADYCSTGAGGAVCQIVLNAGSFLTAAP
ncbi:hypothetical protein [Hyphomonas sp.]|jgi:hypothetical protein|uniref:hypothetical protein n=1 Tax=Hyphomonas sp. TaxID=87 RepID=UPI0025B840C5|nr:hypothetical protein [Hyphomonas sp.]